MFDFFIYWLIKLKILLFSCLGSEYFVCSKLFGIKLSQKNTLYLIRSLSVYMYGTEKCKRHTLKC